MPKEKRILSLAMDPRAHSQESRNQQVEVCKLSFYCPTCWLTASVTAPKSDESKSKSKKPKRKRRNDDDDYLDPEDYEYRPSAKRGAPAEDAMPEQKVDNPLPDYVDPITLEKVEEPFLSPFGHVMDRKTWGRVLMREPRNICPFTKNKLHKRDLIRLTHENIEEHRSKIVNFR